MSIRYVWGRYNVAIINQLTKGESIGTYVSGYGSYGYVASSYSYRNGDFYPSNLVSASGKNAYTYPYFFKDSNAEENGASSFYSSANRPSTNAYWERNDPTREYSIQDPAVGAHELFRFYMTETQSQGSKIDDIATPTSGQYPSNGVSGSYWYVYQGQDSIDPVSIEAPVTNWLYIGQQVVVTASPSISKVYGGTVSYQYQVQINGGSWTNIGSKTTATSVNYTIPEGTVSIAFRVQASDDLGFTSTDRVQSETYTVSKYKPGIKHRVYRKNEAGEYDITHFETDTSCVLMSDGTSLEDQLVNIISEIERRGG